MKKINLLGIIVLIFSVFSSAVYLDFSRPDDKWMLLDNILVSQATFTFDYFKKVFSSFNSIQFSPLNTLYYALIYTIDSYNPYYYHLGSIFFHSINAVVMYFVILRLLNFWEIRGNTKTISFLSVMFWAIHPVNVEAVTWVSASKIILSTGFLLLGILCFIKRRSLNKSIFSIGTIIFFLLACLCKEQAVVFLPMVVIIDYVKDRRLLWKKIIKSFKWEYITITIITILFIVITFLANKDSMLSLKYTVYERLVLSTYSLFFYGINLIIPYNLHYHYPFLIKPGQPFPIEIYLFTFLVGMILIYIITKKIYQKKAFNLILLGIVPLILCLHIIPMYRPAMVADRYLYLPSVFFIPAIFCFFNKKIETNITSMIFVILMLIYYTSYSFILTSNWSLLNI